MMVQYYEGVSEISLFGLEIVVLVNIVGQLEIKLEEIRFMFEVKELYICEFEFIMN